MSKKNDWRSDLRGYINQKQTNIKWKKFCCYCNEALGKQQDVVRDEVGNAYCSNFCYALATGAIDTATAMVFDQEDRAIHNGTIAREDLKKDPFGWRDINT